MLQRRSRSTVLPPPSAIDDEQPEIERGPDGQAGVRLYRMVQQLAAVGHDFFIQNDQGEKLFKVDGETSQVRDSLVFRDMDGNELCKIQLRQLQVRDTFEVERPLGETLVSVKKTMMTPLRDRFTIRIEKGPVLSVQGNILDHEYRISDDRRTVAVVSKKWFRARGSYGVEIAPGKNDIAILAATVCIDQMVSPAR
ncbi:MAG TPA: LURP-one-related family protein [Thermomicrobiales bacterium]|nr:LURP-one-related family protein [Thermomicrobiales bacterium]